MNRLYFTAGLINQVKWDRAIVTRLTFELIPFDFPNLEAAVSEDINQSNYTITVSRGSY